MKLKTVGRPTDGSDGAMTDGLRVAVCERNIISLLKISQPPASVSASRLAGVVTVSVKSAFGCTGQLVVDARELSCHISASEYLP